ncbi:serine protease inhibitor 42Dd-like [Tribolium castaneum]|uniref:serine protease inhibitor 42Dd-like n=1 Tax=Tribolium castaneum TaxID=7070 RepID=UPI0030FEDDD9
MKHLLYFLALLRASVSDEIARQELTTSTNLFSEDLYKTIAKTSAKTFLASPLSTEIALALAQTGCKGETGEEIRSSLFLPTSQSDIESGFSTLLTNYLTGNGFYTLHTLNKIYVRRNFQVKENFKRVVKQVFRSESQRIDFTKRAKAAQSMNKWAEKNSRNRIRNIAVPNSLTARTRMVFLNGLYFRANWSKPFQLSLTRKDVFHVNSTTSVPVDMMRQNGAQLYNVFENPALDAQFLELPLRGDEASMVLVLPNSPNGLAILESQIGKVLEPFESNLDYVNLAVPKFRIDTRINLKFVLKNLGVNKAFDLSQADCSGIGGKKGDLAISEIFQKSFIDVGEGGVEASAGTDDDETLVINTTPNFRNFKDFVADHPFLFYVKIKKIIAFVGRVLDPTV